MEIKQQQYKDLLYDVEPGTKELKQYVKKQVLRYQDKFVVFIYLYKKV